MTLDELPRRTAAVLAAAPLALSGAAAAGCATDDAVDDNDSK